jgi:alkyl hydroperoxide reductase subunit AhpC
VYIIQSISADYRVLLEGPGIALRGLFLISPQGVLEQITVNNLPVGRSVVSVSVVIASVYYAIPHSTSISNVGVVIQLLCRVVYTAFETV